MQPAQVEKLVEEHHQNLYRFALSLARNEAEAADLVQQAFLKLATVTRGQPRDPDKAKALLYTTMLREFYSLRKETGRFPPVEEEESIGIEVSESPDPAFFREANAVLIMEGMTEIREVFRVPLALFYFGEFTYHEIAGILEVPEGTAMSRLARGRTELRDWLTRRLKMETQPGNVVPLRTASGDE